MPKTYVVPPSPPHNEGKTVAAWTMTVGSVAGTLLAAIGLVMMSAMIIVAGAAVIVVTIIVSLILRSAGQGQKPRSVARS